MTMPSPNLCQLLNRIRAMKDCGAITFTDLAKFLGKPSPRVSEWVMQRKFEPSGEIALRMVQFAALQTLSIAQDPELSEKYRKAFAEVMKKHPVGSENSEKKT
jgi:hypothetical protein